MTHTNQLNAITTAARQLATGQPPTAAQRIVAERQLREADRKRIAWPQTIQYDIDEAQRLLDSIGAPRMTGQTTQLGDVLSRLLWCVYNTRVLEHAKDGNDEHL